MAQTKKTDNDFIRDKMDLRVAHLPDGDITVLDCFSGKGMIWRGVQKITGRKISTLPIDIRNDLTSFHLDGHNQQFMMTMDLSRFNVIDLDAYGVPHEQLQILFDRKYSGTVFVTFIQSFYGKMPLAILRGVGFIDEMIEKSPTLFGRRGWDYFRQWLAANGVTRIHHRSHHRKHYLCFMLHDTAVETRAPADQPATLPARRRRGREVLIAGPV
jgi:hypothetical protein